MTEPKRRGRPPKPEGPTPTRSLRVGSIWEAAQEVANERHETLTSVVEAALRRYVARHRRRQP